MLTHCSSNGRLGSQQSVGYVHRDGVGGGVNAEDQLFCCGQEGAVGQFKHCVDGLTKIMGTGYLMNSIQEPVPMIPHDSWTRFNESKVGLDEKELLQRKIALAQKTLDRLNLRLSVAEG